MAIDINELCIARCLAKIMAKYKIVSTLDFIEWLESLVLKPVPYPQVYSKQVNMITPRGAAEDNAARRS